jgi:uncharacterized protein YodC (DUF2158 family)
MSRERDWLRSIHPEAERSTVMSTTESTPSTAPFIVGDVVNIRSGGPLMTVTAVTDDEVTVSWFTRRAPDLQTATLPRAALMRAELGE